MYPTIYHALYDMFGFDWPWARLLNSFGFFVALAFVVGSYALSSELKRKAKMNLFIPTKRIVTIGEGPQWIDIITSGLMGFVIGWKMVYLFMNSEMLFSEGGNPQRHIFSGEGNVLLGILLALGFGGWRFWEYKKKQLAVPIKKEIDIYPHDLTGNITFLAAVFGILGAKVFHLLENPEELVEFFTKPSFNSFISGLTVYGGLILGAIGVLLYAKTKKINGWHLCDAAAPSLILSYGIGRIGCQVSGDGDWGIANNSPKPGWLSWMPDWIWAYDYPNNVNYDASVPYHIGPLNDTSVLPITDPSVPCFDGYCTHLSPPVYPTPFYETVMAVLIFLFLWRIRKRIKIPGVMFAIYMIFNGVERFFIEKIRVNNKFDLFGIQATQAEIIAVFFIIGGFCVLFWKRKQYAEEQATSTMG